MILIGPFFFLPFKYFHKKNYDGFLAVKNLKFTGLSFVDKIHRINLNVIFDF